MVQILELHPLRRHVPAGRRIDPGIHPGRRESIRSMKSFSTSSHSSGRDVDLICRRARTSGPAVDGNPDLDRARNHEDTRQARQSNRQEGPVGSTACTASADARVGTDRRPSHAAAVEDVWGIGRRWAKRLHELGIRTALDLSRVPPLEIRRGFNVVAMRTALELRGTPCQEVEEVESSSQDPRPFKVVRDDGDTLGGHVRSDRHPCRASG